MNNLNDETIILMVVMQSKEGCGPGYQCGSSPGAAGLGHEPQPAHLSGPGRRSYPGDRNRH